MKVMIINGSPRKDKNTATLLRKAAEGAISTGADVEFKNLYDYDFAGCHSCFACKVKGSHTNGLCGIHDQVRPLLEACLNADAIILGSPIYYDNISGMMRSFLERMWYPLDSNKYDDNGERVRILQRHIPTAFIYTMNCPESLREQIYAPMFNGIESTLKNLLGSCTPLYACDTYQFDDYSRYDADMFSEERKAKQRAEQWPVDCQKAYDLGKTICNEQ
ncbi:MAG: flavodoxin family protein [Alistipes sp.]|nr:flavodoxin family protein [Alistipes sp.]